LSVKEICEGMKTVDLTGIVPEESSKSQTGYVNIIELKNGKFQARLQVPGDGPRARRREEAQAVPVARQLRHGAGGGPVPGLH
jgi:hypothetical protein